MCDHPWHEAENQARRAGAWDTLTLMEKVALFEAVQRDSRLTFGEYLAKLTAARIEP